MRPLDLLKGIFRAPVFAVVAAGLGLAMAALIVSANVLDRRVVGVDYGSVGDAVDVIANSLPGVLAIVGFIAAFVPDTKLPSPVFGSARWANRKELAALSDRPDELLIGRSTDRCAAALRWAGASSDHGADANGQGGRDHHSQFADRKPLGTLHRSQG